MVIDPGTYSLEVGLGTHDFCSLKTLKICKQQYSYNIILYVQALPLRTVNCNGKYVFGIKKVI